MIGYACIASGVPSSEFNSCIARLSSDARLLEITRHNLNALDILINYNEINGINLFRICSELIPFGSSPVNTTDWLSIFNNEFNALSVKIRKAGIRISMHPGQYTVINSPSVEIVSRAYEDLMYHAQVLDALGGDTQNKIILHVGGVYGDKKNAIKRFKDSFYYIPDRAKNRIVIENDDKFYNINETLEIASALSIPVVYDVLHNAVNPYNSDSDSFWIKECAPTWKAFDGKQKIHYSEQEPGRRPGSHSRGISFESFLKFYNSLTEIPDIMLEVKNKNVSALKCIALTSDDYENILNNEYKRYELLLLAKGAEHLEKAKEAVARHDVKNFYRLIENTEALPFGPLQEYRALRNAADNIYDLITREEATALERAFKTYIKGKFNVNNLKRRLQSLAAKYKQEIQYSYFLIHN